jgi:hypothetical protein
VHVHLVHGENFPKYCIIFISKPQHDTLMYCVAFWCGKCQTGSFVTVQSQFECGTFKIKFHVLSLRAIQICFSSLFLVLFIFLYQYPVTKNYISYMAVQYLQELISIYKGTPMKLLMKKSDFSAVELRL